MLRFFQQLYTLLFKDDYLSRQAALIHAKSVLANSSASASDDSDSDAEGELVHDDETIDERCAEVVLAGPEGARLGSPPGPSVLPKYISVPNPLPVFPALFGLIVLWCFPFSSPIALLIAHLSVSSLFAAGYMAIGPTLGLDRHLASVSAIIGAALAAPLSFFFSVTQHCTVLGGLFSLVLSALSSGRSSPLIVPVPGLSHLEGSGESSESASTSAPTAAVPSPTEATPSASAIPWWLLAAAVMVLTVLAGLHAIKTITVRRRRVRAANSDGPADVRGPTTAIGLLDPLRHCHVMLADVWRAPPRVPI
jgi:hypothetical protein